VTTFIFEMHCDYS